MSASRALSAPQNLVQRAEMRRGEHHRLERPHRPERNQSDECFVLANDARLGVELERKIVAQQARTAPLAAIGALRRELLRPPRWAGSRSPRSGNAGADCWRPSSRRGSRKSALIIFEDECPRVIRVVLSARPLVPRTHVALRIVGRHVLRCRCFSLTFPRPRGSPGRHQHPVSRQRIQSSV
jgi:hypothetical protein